MLRLITVEDFRDIYIKTFQRGFTFITSKFSFDFIKRTKSAFNDSELLLANWWIIPKVRERWNKLITGDENITYEEYFCEKYFDNNENLKFLSLGSGICSHEIEIAELRPNWEIHCFDFSEELLKKAKEISDNKGLKNIFFHANNILKHDFMKGEYDIVFFHASLHHFDHISEFISKVILRILKKSGYLIVNEYVGKNRMLYSLDQIKKINEVLKSIPKKFRKIYKTNIFKNKYYGSGWIRMYMSDPSECVDSESILPEIHKNFHIVEEKPYGGNLLMSALKDISHHFIELDDERKMILEKIFIIEDEYLKNYQSDFIFGIYQMKTSC